MLDTVRFVKKELTAESTVAKKEVEVALVITDEVARRVPLRARVLTADL